MLIKKLHQNHFFLCLKAAWVGIVAILSTIAAGALGYIDIHWMGAGVILIGVTSMLMSLIAVQFSSEEVEDEIHEHAGMGTLAH